MPLSLCSNFTGSASSACLLHGSRRPLRRHLVPTRAMTCSRKEPGRGEGTPDRLLMDRRDVLLGLGGLYGAAAVAPPKKVIASPIMPPDLSKCRDAEAPYLDNHCCPPYTGAEPVYDYDFPATPIRVRRPAHVVKDDTEYLQKYHEAVRRMKALPEDDPWNYYQQALVHCQYCNNAYLQQGTDVPIQVHFSWIFLPWHRYYLHFYERILGKLIDDDTFTIPFWNWDTKEGMTIPEIFEDAYSPLYDASRNQDHVKGGKLLNLKYAFKETDMTDSELIQQNLCVIQKAFKHSLPLAELFMGDSVRAGQKENTEGHGQLEVIHNAAHMWVGTLNQYREDMGDFSTAARDSVFYSHHANVDRLWDIYRNLRGHSLEFDDADWLDSTFIFHDENRKLVHVKIRDCVNTSKLRYTFEQVPLPWLGKLNCTKTTTETTDKKTTELNLTRVAEFGTKPRDLDANAPLRVLVPRPKKNRKKKEKKEKVEVLVIKDISVLTNETARFDVYVAAPYGELAGPDYGEFVGSFSRLAHKRKGEDAKPTKKAKLKLGLTSLVEDIDAEDADKLVVTLVLNTGEVSVGGISINLLQTDTEVAL